MAYCWITRTCSVSNTDIGYSRDQLIFTCKPLPGIACKADAGAYTTNPRLGNGAAYKTVICDKFWTYPWINRLGLVERAPSELPALWSRERILLHEFMHSDLGRYEYHIEDKQ